MAAPSSLQALLESLTQSLSSALQVGPKIIDIKAPKNGVSLLDTKNELLISYLQNLVFLILAKLRDSKEDEPTFQSSDVVMKLAELRLYLEKGVRPLEEKLRFSIDNMIRAADDAERKAAEWKQAPSAGGEDDSESGDDSDAEEQESQGEAANDSDGAAAPPKARPSAFHAAAAKEKEPEPSGVWRPSKTRRVVMPGTEPREKKERRPIKSATIEEYVATELAAAPLAEPSVGTTIVARGRKDKTITERKEEAEKQDYEERNFVRLPKESKKERAKKAKIAGRKMMFGGEEWLDLGEGVDRINRLTKQKDAPKGTRAQLERSRKRGYDGGGPGGAEIGEKFKKRLKRDSGRKR